MNGGGSNSSSSRRKSASDVDELAPLAARTRKSRTLSLRQSYNYRSCIKSDQEPFTINVKAFDQNVANLQDNVCRDTSDAPFNADVWAGIRAELVRISDLTLSKGMFQQPLLDETVVERSTKDAAAVREMEEATRHLLLPLNGTKWAQELNLPSDIVLTEFLYATAAGFLEMWWGPECNGCGAATVREAHLEDIAMEQTCQNCGWPNKTATLDEIKVQFVLHEDILYVPSLLFDFPTQQQAPKMSKFCFGLYAPPTTNETHWSYAFTGNDNEEAVLKPGRYRFHCSYSRVDADIVIERQANPQEDDTIEFEFTTTEMERPARYGLPRQVVHLEHGKVSLHLQSAIPSILNPMVYYNLTQDDEKIFFHKDNAPYITATQCLHLACFGRLFGKQVVSDVSQFVVQKVTLVFTDVVSSTQLYSDSGDGKALDCVKLHFQILFQAFTKRGRIVKTIGDAVMGAFTSGKAALLATAQALDEMQNVKRPCGQALQVRIGVHTGPALMVSLNATNDYFGSNVNIAARVESKAHGGEVLVSEQVLRGDPAAKEYFEQVLVAKEGRFTRHATLELKGVDEKVTVSGFGPRKHTVHGKVQQPVMTPSRSRARTKNARKVVVNFPPLSKLAKEQAPEPHELDEISV